MPYVSLADQGFYKPFEILTSAAQDWRARRDKKKEDEKEQKRYEQEFGLRQNEAQSRIDSANIDRGIAKTKLSDLELKQADEKAKRSAFSDLESSRPGEDVQGKFFAELPPEIQDVMVGRARGFDPNTTAQAVQAAYDASVGARTGHLPPVQLPITPEGMSPSEISIGPNGPTSKFIPENWAGAMAGGEGILPPDMEATGGIFTPGRPPTLYGKLKDAGGAQVLDANGDPTGYLNIGGRKVLDPRRRGLPPTAAQENKMYSQAQVQRGINELTDLTSQAGDAGGPLASKLLKPVEFLTGPTKEHALFDAGMASLRAPIAKGVLGDTGNLAIQEQLFVENLIPKFEDTQANRLLKLQQLQKIMTGGRGALQQLMQARGIDTSKYQTGAVAPAPPPSISSDQEIAAGPVGIPNVSAPVQALAPGGSESESGVSGGVTEVRSQQEYDALPPGAKYKDSTGKTKIKRAVIK